MTVAERPGSSAPASGPDEVVRALFDAFARRDADGLCAVCAEDVVFHAVTGRLTHQGEPYRGHDGLRRYLRDAARVWEEVSPEPHHVEVRGDVVVVTGRIYAWGEGRVIDQAAGWTFILRNGLIARARVHETAREALAGTV